MTDLSGLFIVFFAGLLLGGFYFGGLWWTVQKGLASENPALWFFGSLLLRTALILAAFYFLSRGDWSRLFACVVGFMIARILVVQRLTKKPTANMTPSETETIVAHQPR
jgi:F1F0 ATPase subunit 2